MSQIKEVQMYPVNKNGLLASFWVTLTNDVSFKVVLVESKSGDKRRFISLPSERYNDGNEVKYRKLMSVSQDLYTELTETLSARYDNHSSGGAVREPVPAPKQETAGTRPEISVPEIEDLLDQA